MGRRPALDLRGCGEIDPEADDHSIALPLKQDPRHLRSIKEQVVRPFEKQWLAWDGCIERFDESKTRNQGQRLRRRIASSDRNQRASEEITAFRQPLAALAALSGGLLKRDQPVPFGRALIREEVGVGRAGSLDNPDSGQRSAPAARSASVPSGPMRR